MEPLLITKAHPQQNQLSLWACAKLRTASWVACLNMGSPGAELLVSYGDEYVLPLLPPKEHP